ncbi:MAG: hypothetical protein SVR94_05765 [Pseudomonadota bacterium]|nr:hypothetical protein [Pseudomonadota bacterium]
MFRCSLRVGLLTLSLVTTSSLAAHNPDPKVIPKPCPVSSTRAPLPAPIEEEYFIDKPGSLKDLIKPNQYVYYPGDTIKIELQLPCFLKGLTSKVDAYILVYTPEGELIPTLVEITTDKPYKFLEMPNLEVLAKGDYHLALLLTQAGGNPFNVNEWYQGFNGLLSFIRIKIAPKIDAEDQDHDGIIDGDFDNDGFPDRNLFLELFNLTEEQPSTAPSNAAK